MTEAGQISVRSAQWPQDIAATRALLLEYGRFLDSSPITRNHAAIGRYEQEVAALPGRWSGPDAAVLLAWQNGAAVGCVAVHMVAYQQGACEMKRLWVPKSCRGAGVGRMLVNAATDWARDKGASALLLDTAPDAMPEAVGLYRRMGFLPCEGYRPDHLPGLAFFRLELE